MKKLITLLLAAGMAWSLHTPVAAHAANSVEVKLSGILDFTFERRNISGTEAYGNNQFDALQRLRLGMDFIASENLSAYFMLQVGTGLWGSSAQNSNFGQDFSGGDQSDVGQARISTRFMYLDWIVPATKIKVRMGKQNFSMPSFAWTNSPMSGGIRPGINITAPINDNLVFNLAWQHPSNNERSVDDTPPEERFRTLDIVSLALPMKFEGFHFGPYAQVGFMGNRTQEYVTGVPYYSHLQGRQNLPRGTSFVWWAGFASQLTMFDPFTLSLDFVYGSKKAGGSNGMATFTTVDGTSFAVNNTKLANRSGWMAALKMNYKTAYGTPTLLTWYGSGDSASQSKGSGQLLTPGGSPGSCLGVASTYYDFPWSLGSGRGNVNIAGTWGVSLGWMKISFMKDLFHDFTVTYFQGTNSPANVYKAGNPHSAYAVTPYGNALYGHAPGYKAAASPYRGYLTSKDSAVDINLISTYAIYKNLAANLELGYMFANFDETIRADWNANGTIKSKPKLNNIWRVALNIRYMF